MYILTTDKTEHTYNEILAELKRLQPQFNPTDFTIDFEKAAMNAITEQHPLADIHGCHFHLGQNVWKHVQSVGLQAAYTSDANFALNIRMLIALAFVPEESIVEAFDELVTTDFYSEDSSSPHKDAIQLLLGYYQTTYVYRLDRTGNRKDPLFPPRIWCVHEQTLTGKSCKKQ